MQINPRQFHSNFVVPQYRLGTGKPVVADSAMAVALCAIRCQANRCLRLQVGQQPGRPDADALLAEEVRRGRLTSPALKNAGAPPSPPPVAPLFMPHRVKRIDRVTADSSPPAAPSDGRNTDFSVPPRRRGNHAVGWDRNHSAGPIPAQAGEPTTRPPAETVNRAYPRAGEGTMICLTIHGDGPGLSPRRRGNHLTRGQISKGRGPIPAQAGEPGGCSRGTRRPRAYPRAGGGTAADVWGEIVELGLSPRRRGNHRGVDALLHLLGPIPAQAGEPSRPSR